MHVVEHIVHQPVQVGRGALLETPVRERVSTGRGLGDQSGHAVGAEGVVECQPVGAGVLVPQIVGGGIVGGGQHRLQLIAVLG